MLQINSKEELQFLMELLWDGFRDGYPVRHDFKIKHPQYLEFIKKIKEIDPNSEITHVEHEITHGKTDEGVAYKDEYLYLWRASCWKERQNTKVKQSQVVTEAHEKNQRAKIRVKMLAANMRNSQGWRYNDTFADIYAHQILSGSKEDALALIEVLGLKKEILDDPIENIEDYK